MLDGSPAPLLKICDFGYSKVCELDVSDWFIKYVRKFVYLINSIYVVIPAAFKTKVNCRNSSIYCSRSSFSKRVWWQGNLVIPYQYDKNKRSKNNLLRWMVLDYYFLVSHRDKFVLWYRPLNIIMLLWREKFEPFHMKIHYNYYWTIFFFWKLKKQACLDIHILTQTSH